MAAEPILKMNGNMPNGYVQQPINGDTANSQAVLETDPRIQTVHSALAKLKQLASGSAQYREALNHENITVLAAQPVAAEPVVFKASASIADCSAQQALEQLGRPELWDDWNPQTKVLEEIGQHYAHVHVTFDVVPKSKFRVTSLVEGVQHQPDGGVLFAATTFDGESGRPIGDNEQKGDVALSGWIITPKATGVEITHYLQIDSKTFLPKTASKKLLPRHVASNVAAVLDNLRPTASSQMDEVAATPSPSPKKKRMSLLKNPVASIRSRRRSNSVYSSSMGGSKSRASSLFLGGEATSTPDEVGGDEARIDGLPASSSRANLATAGVGSSPAGHGNGVPVIDEGVEPKSGGGRHRYPAALQPTNATALAKKDLFDKLLKESAQWKCAQDQDGNRIWTQFGQESPVPIIKTEVTISTEISSTEAIVGALLHPVFRSQWNIRYLKESCQSLNAAEGVCQWREIHGGIYPHIPDHTLNVNRAIFRSNPHSADPVITLIMYSDKDTKHGQLVLSGWQIIRTRSGHIALRHIHHYVPAQIKFPAFIGKAYAVLNAQSLAKLRSIIAQNGVPAYLVRPSTAFIKAAWTDAQGSGFEVDAKQISSLTDASKIWLSFHPKVYPNGINIIDSSKKLSVASVEQFPGLVELTWSETPSSDAKIIIASNKTDSRFPAACVNGIEAGKKISAPTGDAVKDTAEQQEQEEELAEDDPAEMAAVAAAAGAAGAAGITTAAMANTSEGSRDVAVAKDEKDISSISDSKDSVSNTMNQIKSVDWMNVVASMLMPPHLYVLLIFCFMSFMAGRESG